MGFSCGIVGLPNVGKSTLFNALLAQQQAEAANYPFCTIEPNTGKVAVPDERLQRAAEIAKSAQIIPTQLEFVDIAGLVRGASRGEGLGNQFLAHIREVDAIAYVVRCFIDDDITHVEGRIDPLSDWEIIETELILADMESLEKRKVALEKKARGNDKEAMMLLPFVERGLELAAEGKPLRSLMAGDSEAQACVRGLNLLTTKPVMVICNVAEDDAASGNELTRAVAQRCIEQAVPCVVISARIESEIAGLESEQEKLEFLSSLGLNQTGLARIIAEGYGLLDLITFFTVGPKEARAWTVHQGARAPQAAGRIHSDFEKGFIRAETIAYADYVTYQGEAGCKDAGKMRLEGKDYLVHDGDIFHFRFNV
ncbi:MAG: redox-regulated ATPase YchF [Alphaproteobacteria bacterium]|nr:MAG: redox-regulated ATPase YchF [Alphaproteobacteria bacterium]TAF76644.1 MAG: redox-regulated ATPase YchF [Alphaproteobacteria bacterium]